MGGKENMKKNYLLIKMFNSKLQPVFNIRDNLKIFNLLNKNKNESTNLYQ